MTRDIKIGLLVGLAFIIVVGILLSDRFRTAGEPPDANMVGIGSNVRTGVGGPGAGDPRVEVFVPREAPPHGRVPTQSEINPPASPVIPIGPHGNPQDRSATGIPGDLQRAAAGTGEQFVQIQPDGTPLVTGTPANPAAAGSASPRSYVAQAGDTLSRMAGRFLGTNTKQTRQAIIDANPALKNNPDKIVVGTTYMIPVPPQSAATPPAMVAGAPLAAQPPTINQPATPAQSPRAVFVYTAKTGDSLWRIASEELGDPSTLAAIQQLNLDVLKGKNHDGISVGMKLRLPAVPSHVAD